MLLLISVLIACGDKVSDTASPAEVVIPEWCADEPAVTYDNFGEGFLLTHCQGCHAQDAPNRFGAPDNVYFDTADDVDVWREAILRVIFDDGSMPPAGGLTDDEQALSKIWLECDL